MSYLDTPGFYTNQPSAYVRPDFDSRVPGWGPVRHAAGPSMWGVGAIAPMRTAVASRMAVSPVLASKVPIAQKRVVDGGTVPPPPAAETGGIPWWVWVAAPMALGGIALIAYDMGWLGGGAKP